MRDLISSFPRLSPKRIAHVAVLVAILAGMHLLLASPGEAQDKQEKPRHGGELVFLVPSEPPTYDAHREGTFGTAQPLAPFYNLNHQLDTVWLAE